MATYVFRSQAIAAARKAGHANFRTSIDRDRMWKFHYEPGVSPAAEWAVGKDYVNNVETRWEGGKRIGVVVVTITRAELDEILPFVKAQTAEFEFEPLTPELFQTDAQRALTSSHTRAKGPARTSGQRAKSDAVSPVKIVWETAEAMPGASRQEVIAACVEKGVNKATASTQFYRWQKSK